jgi:glycosyltransferase involved in cell wall biosynthesis
MLGHVMHICLLASDFFFAASDTARYTRHFTRLFSRAGHQITVFASGDTPRDECLPDGTRLITIVPHTSTTVPALYRTLSHWPALSYEFAEAVIEHLKASGDRPDVIEIQEYGALGYFLLQRRLVENNPLRDIPILVHLHSPHAENLRVNHAARYRFPDYWVGQMERFCVNATDALLSPSHYLKDQLLAQGYTNQPIDVIPYPGCDPLAVADPICQPTPGDLVYLGCLETRKGVLPMLKACANLWQEGIDFRLTLVGGDAAPIDRHPPISSIVREKYRRFIHEGRLILTDALPHAEAMTCLNAAWAALVPSLYENYPYTCLEAMQAGKVVIASTSGGQAEMLGTEGVLFDWSEESSLEHSLRSVLHLTLEENLALGQRARQRIQALTSYGVVLPQRLAHYQHTVEQARAQRHNRIFPAVNWDLPSPAPLTSADATQCDLLSVVIPFYNLGVYVEQALDSILASIYRPMEIVIVDDGSTEPQSLAALDRIQARHLDNLRVVHSHNRGLSLTRNLGAQQARGHYLAFVDADDLVEPEFFERAICVLKSYDNVGLVYSWVQYFEGNDEWWPAWNTEFPYLLGHNMLTPLAVTYRAAFLQHAQNRPEMSYGYEDWDGWIRLAAAGYLGVSLPQRLVKYRVRHGSMLRQITSDQFLYLYETIIQGSPDTFRHYAPELLNLINANGPQYLWEHPTRLSQPSTYNTLKGVFFWIASRPGLGWLNRLRRPLRKLYSRWRT